MARSPIHRVGHLALLVVAGVGLAAAVEPEGGAAAHDLEVMSAATAPSLDAATTHSVELEVLNRGLVPWSGELGFALSYHWFDVDGGVVVWDGARTPLVGVIRPGEGRIIDAIVRTPDAGGQYCLQWDVVHEGELWVSEVDPTPETCQPVTVVSTHAFSVVRIDEPRVVPAGGERPATVVVRNDGRRSWPPDGSVSLSYHWFDGGGGTVEWEGRRSPVRRAVAPGETIELRTRVTAPAGAGRYRLQWDMVDDGVCWFSERDGTAQPAAVVIVVPTVVGARAWTALVALAAAVVVVRGRRGGLAGWWSMIGVGWCVVAMIVKQSWVLHGAGIGMTASGWCLTVASAVVVGLIVAAVPDRLRHWTAWMVVAMVTAVLFVDLVHERFFGDLASLAAMRSAGQLGQVAQSVASLLRGDDLWFWADILPALVMVWGLTRFCNRRPLRRGRVVGAVAISAAIVLTVVGMIALDETKSLRQVFQTTQLASRIGVLNLHAGDLGGSLVRLVARPRLEKATLDEVIAFFDRRRVERAGSGPLFGVSRGRNLIMIQVESLQAFVVGLRIGGREVTPTLNALTEESFWFSNITDQTEEGRSSDAELATQVSLLPPDRGAAAFLYADNRFVGLASVLAGQGYSTVSAVPFEGSFWNRRTTHRAYGYERSLFVDDFGPGETIGWGLNDRDFLVQAVDRLAGLPEPWAAYLLTLSLHHPFDGFPDHLKSFDVGDWDGTPFGNFLHTMHHFDGALSEFLSELDRLGLAETTVIALWGDHDAGFEWRTEIAEVAGFAPDAVGWYLSQRVPMVIRVPGVDGPARPLSVPGGHVDAAPTLLALLGIDPSPFAFIGRNLLGAPGPGPVVGEYRCWRDDTHLYLRRGPELGDGQCIELRTMKEVDPEACAASFEVARQQVEISNIVLDHDLQEAVGAALSR